MLESFLLQRLFNNSGIPIYLYKTGEVQDSGRQYQRIFGSLKEQAIYESDEALLNKIAAAADKSELPLIYIETSHIFHGAFRDKDNQYYIWGPVSFSKLSQPETREYNQGHLMQEGGTIACSSYNQLSNILSIAYYFYAGKKVEEENISIKWMENEKEISDQAEMELYQLEKAEWDRIHNSIEYENTFIEAVEQGNIAMMKELARGAPEGIEGIGNVADSMTKQMEYLGVASVTLTSRAAIRGGMNPEEAYDMSDLYLQKLEKCRTIEEMEKLTGEMQMNYVKQVKLEKEKKKSNLHVERCKDYIANHLRKKFQVSDISDELGLNRSYLSKVFKMHEGVTIQQYIIAKRCEHAANMLRYTNYTTSIIADYFCFTNQSHFSLHFKRIYGVTPGEYRRKNKYIESFLKI